MLGRRHMAKHFQISITDDTFSFAQTPLSVAAEAALDGYVIRTNLPATHSAAAATVRAYKSLSGVEHAFRSLKTVDLELRPVFHWTAPRVRAHVLLCMLAYYLQWYMRRSLAPMLFDEPDPAAREAQRTSLVAKAEPSPAAQRKAAGKRTEPADREPLPVHSFHTLLGDLATLTRNVVRLGRDRLTAIPRHPHPHTAPRPRSARRYPHCVDRPTPSLQTISMVCAQKSAKFGLGQRHKRIVLGGAAAECWRYMNSGATTSASPRAPTRRSRSGRARRPGRCARHRRSAQKPAAAPIDLATVAGKARFRHPIRPAEPREGGRVVPDIREARLGDAREVEAGQCLRRMARQHFSRGADIQNCLLALACPRCRVQGFRTDSRDAKIQWI